MLKPSSHDFLGNILSIGERDIDRLCILLDINKKQFWYKLSLLNNEIEDYNLFIDCHQNQLIINNKLKEKLQNLLNNQIISLFELQEERIYILYLLISSKDEFISTAHFQDFFDLSRNTIMLDLRKLREWTEPLGVKVTYNRSDGYDLSGVERNIRRLMEESISRLKRTLDLENIIKIFEKKWMNALQLEKLSKVINDILNNHNLQMVLDRTEEFILLVHFLIKRKNSQNLIYKESEVQLLKAHPLYQIAKELSISLFQEKLETETFFIESRLLGVIQGDYLEPNMSFFSSLVDEILLQLNTILYLGDDELEKLRKTLYIHIVPAYYRLLFNVYYDNPLLEKVKQDYSDLFELTKFILNPLESILHKKISESEIAYFTIHFGGYIERYNDQQDNRELKAVVVCPNGISSSLIMNATIRETFPEISVMQLYNLNKLDELKEDTYDMIFSTVYFATNKKLYITSPILNPVERDILREKVSSDFMQLTKHDAIKVKELVNIIEKHTIVEHKEALINDLNNYIYKRKNNDERMLKNLNELLNRSLIRISDKELSWRESIREASQILLERNYIKEEYIEAMIETVENIGPYIVLAPKVAVPHARPEKGVNKLGISLLKLDNKVNFNTEGEDDADRYVQLIFVLAAVDGEAHLKALMQLSKILDDSEKIERLIESDNVDDLYETIDYYVQKEE